MNTDQRFTEIMEKFKLDAVAIITDAVTDIHNDWMPYMEADTESNVNERASDVIDCILRGLFNVESNEYGVYVCVMVNGINCRVKVDTNGFHTGVLDNLVNHMPECPKDLKIKNLEWIIVQMEKAHRVY